MERIFRYPVTVGPESIDVLGHTNNKEYLRWMEQAALAHSDSLGWPMRRYLAAGFVFVASRHVIEYLRPTFKGDELVLYTWVETMEGARSRRIFCLKKGTKTCMQAMTEWTLVDMREARSKAIPADLAKDFPIVTPEDAVLKELGLRVKFQNSSRN